MIINYINDDITGLLKEYHQIYFWGFTNDPLNNIKKCDIYCSPFFQSETANVLLLINTINLINYRSKFHNPDSSFTHFMKRIVSFLESYAEIECLSKFTGNGEEILNFLSVPGGLKK